VSSQNADGGFGLARSSASGSDMTGAALQALATVGRGRAAQRAVAWLRANQNDDGGFGQFKGQGSNAQSTSYAVQGLLAAGAGGGAASRARAYLLGLQRRDGSVAYSSTSSQTPVWVTAQALMALEREALPLAPVPRTKRRARASAASEERGGGASAEDGGGKAGGSKKGSGAGGGAAAGGAAATGALEDAGAAGGQPGAIAEEGSSAPLAVDSAPRSGAAKAKPVPVWAAIVAALGIIALLWLLHRYVLPRGRPRRVE
jgi:hypothetical protein